MEPRAEPFGPQGTAAIGPFVAFRGNLAAQGRPIGVAGIADRDTWQPYPGAIEPVRHILLTSVVVLLAGSAKTPAGEQVRRDEVVRALLERSRLLEDVYVCVPIGVYREFLAATAPGVPVDPPAPVAWIARTGQYRLAVDADGRPTLAATVALRVFHPRRCRNLAVLTARWAWREILVNGKPATLVAHKGWLRFTPAKAGQFLISANVALDKARGEGGTLAFETLRTVRTLVQFDSPRQWDLAVKGAPGTPRAEGGQGTHAQLALSPCRRVELAYTRPQHLPPRPARYELQGAIAWNLDAGRQQVAAQLRVRILGGRTDRLDLRLPPGASRVVITGPDVRDRQASPGGAAVFLRGKISGQTRLRASYELPLGRSSVKRLSPIGLASGHWSGGTLVITNTAGGSEVLAQAARGLREMHPADLPAEARAILLGKPVLAYEITSRTFSASVDVLDLGEFALRESIADLAHYQLLMRGDGSVLCKVEYEVRNRSRQFLRVELPAGAIPLVARVNDRPRPLAPLAGKQDVYFLPLVRSKASVKGLVSFPVQILVLFRGDALRRGDGRLALPLPRIDLPIAYGWCEVRVPEGLRVRQWGGPLRHVQQYSSETATTSLTYGRGELAEGYKLEDRPMTAERISAEEPGLPAKPAPKPTPARKPSDSTKERAPATQPGRRPPRPGAPGPPAIADSPERAGEQAILARNYYRAGRDYYERGWYDEAAASLTQGLQLSPKSPAAANAERLLSNIRMVRGKTIAKSREEKALGRQVKREISGLNVRLEEQQRRMLEKGEEAVRSGKWESAAAQFKAAQALGEQLIAQGADEKEQTLRLRGATDQLGRLQEKRQQRAAKIQERYKVLKGKGQYEAALKLGKALQQADARAQHELRNELEELAVKALKERTQPEKPRTGEAEHKDVDDTIALRRWRLEKGGKSDSHSRAPRPATPDATREGLGRRARGRGAGRPRLGYDGWAQTAPAQPKDPGKEAAPRRGTVAFSSDWDTVFGTGALARAGDRVAERGRPTVGGTDAGFRLDRLRGPQPGDAAKANVVRLKNADAAGVASALQRLFKGDGKPDIRADAGASALVVVAPPDQQKRIHEMIRQLDAPDGAGLLRRGKRRQAVTKIYDVRDLVYGEAAPSQDGPGRSPAGRGKAAEGLLGTVRSTLGGKLGGGGAGMLLSNGRLTVSATPDGQKLAADLFARLRSIRGPQVEVGGKIAQQRAAGVLDTDGDLGTVDMTGGEADVEFRLADGALRRPADSSRALAGDAAFQEFLARNYDWQVRRPAAGGGWSYGGTSRGYFPMSGRWGKVSGQTAAGGQVWGVDGTDLPGIAASGRPRAKRQLAERLLSNLGQKVGVNSMNIEVDAATAGRFGMHFVKGTNGVNYAVVDEAQLRTLREMEAHRTKSGRSVASNLRFQETIVGTDALLASGQVANVAFAADRGNTIMLYGNTVSLPHERYVLIDNGEYVTAVRAGEMQHWAEPAKPIEFAEVPQDIDVPRVGRLVKFEKALIKPSDVLTIGATYTW